MDCLLLRPSARAPPFVAFSASGGHSPFVGEWDELLVPPLFAGIHGEWRQCQAIRR